MSLSPWQEEQVRIWGTGDTMKHVVERIASQEDRVIAEVEDMVKRGVVPHAIVKFVTNSILRGYDVAMGNPSDG